MKQVKLLIRASTPLFILLFFRITGTTKAEYEANFRKVGGDVKGPYILIFENFNVVTNDSLRGGDNAFSEFQSLIYRHDLDRPYRKFLKEVKQHDMNWNTHQIDSLGTLPTETAWNQIKAREEGFVYSRDTVFHSEARYPIDIPVKLSVFRSISARVFFSLGESPDKLQLVFPDDEEKEDPYGLRKRIRMSRGGQLAGKYTYLADYYEQLQQFTSQHATLTAKRLNTKAINGRVYKVWNGGDELIFEDEEGLKGLEYQTTAYGMIDVMSEEGDGRFILWYDHWYMYLLMGIQLLIYAGLLLDWKDPKKYEPEATDE
ncbi:MAG: hypothetical protein R8G66_03380 [Cytophagales bacterium]|nr:hypothetical protein [Cytophagales bacterium]